MHCFEHFGRIAACAALLVIARAPTLGAQATRNQTDAALTSMRADFAAKRYAAVRARGNELLESARAITMPERMQIWQLLAAAYYPMDASAQHADSAQLPLAAIMRNVPDFKMAPELSWPGLDALTERIRVQSFSVVSRPLGEYLVSASTPGHITVVASRPTRFVLRSVNGATGRVFVHDSSSYGTVAAMQLRARSSSGYVFTDGSHLLHIVAYDSVTGDSVRITHRVRAVRNDLPTPARVARQAVAEPRAAPPPVPPPVPPVRMKQSRRSALLWGGLALAAATVVIAQERPNDIISSTFRADSRVYIVGAAMVAGVVANNLPRGAPPPAVTPRPTVAPTVAPTVPPPVVDTYRVRLLIDPQER